MAGAALLSLVAVARSAKAQAYPSKMVKIIVPSGPGGITDFNSTIEHDRVAISAGGFGGGLSAGMDVTSIFESSGDDQFSGSGAQFHFDSANQTLYFSADGTQASAIAVTSVQAGVVLNPHDILVV